MAAGPAVIRAARLWRGTSGSLGISWAFARVPLWLAIPRRAALARRIEQRFFRRLLRSLGIRLRVSGEASQTPGTLYVVNHVSWADIPVLAALLDAAFVAKAEAGSWPLIGGLMQRYGVVLVDRNNRGRSGDQVDAITRRLDAGQSVILFAEGTTSLGETILPFRSALLQSARSALCVQPVVLRYLDRNGGALPPERQRDVAWIDDDTLAGGIVRVMRTPMLAAVEFLASVPARDCADRKALAAQLHARMVQAYAALPNRSR
jgi:1-acyl-sn-glycerol-3-phosphate acyltransferase